MAARFPLFGALQQAFARRRHTRGAALLIGLVILMLVTLLALLAARLATLQERAVGAHRADGVSRLQAESALATAERLLAHAPAATLCDGGGIASVHWFADDARLQAFVAPDQWPETTGTAAPFALPGATVPAKAPRHLIEAVAFVADAWRTDASPSPSPPLAALFACHPDAPPGVAWFRVTARGTGPEPLRAGAPRASAVVQSFYAVRLRGPVRDGETWPRRVAWREID